MPKNFPNTPYRWKVGHPHLDPMNRGFLIPGPTALSSTCFSVHQGIDGWRTVKCPSGIGSVASHCLTVPIWTAVSSSICSWVWSCPSLPQSSSPIPWSYDLHSLVLLWFDLILQLALILQSRCLVLSPQQLSKRAGSSVSLLSNPLPLYQLSACLHIRELSESWCLLQPSCNYFVMVTKRILMIVRCIMCDIRIDFTI